MEAVQAPDLVKIIEELSLAGTGGDKEAIYGIVERFASVRSFKYFAYQLVRPPEGARRSYYIANYPVEWVERYVDRGYVNHDPVVITATRALIPFTWGNLRGNRRFSDAERLVFDEGGEFQIRDGVSVPLRGPSQAFALFSVGVSTRPRRGDAVLPHIVHEVQIFAAYLHDVVMRHLYDPTADLTVALSPRERECLLWTARGKTAWEISVILGISDEAVTFYIKAACRKLQVNNKVHATVVAIMRGMIVP
jgi:DNA-binding CsgD family transcriptional regulator